MSKTSEKILHEKDLIKIGRIIEKMNVNQVVSILEMELDEEGETMKGFFEIKKIKDGAK